MLSTIAAAAANDSLQSTTKTGEFRFGSKGFSVNNPNMYKTGHFRTVQTSIDKRKASQVKTPGFSQVTEEKKFSFLKSIEKPEE